MGDSEEYVDLRSPRRRLCREERLQTGTEGDGLGMEDLFEQAAGGRGRGPVGDFVPIHFKIATVPKARPRARRAYASAGRRTTHPVEKRKWGSVLKRDEADVLFDAQSRQRLQNTALQLLKLRAGFGAGAANA